MGPLKGPLPTPPLTPQGEILLDGQLIETWRGGGINFMWGIFWRSLAGNLGICWLIFGGGFSCGGFLCRRIFWRATCGDLSFFIFPVFLFLFLFSFSFVIFPYFRFLFLFIFPLSFFFFIFLFCFSFSFLVFPFLFSFIFPFSRYPFSFL